MPHLPPTTPSLISQSNAWHKCCCSLSSDFLATSLGPIYELTSSFNMQLPRLVKAAQLDRRQVNPAAYSGVTDQISNLGQSAGDKAAQAASGLTRTQVALVIVFCIIGVVLFVAALFWLCSCSRRRKRARELREKSELLRFMPSSESSSAPAFTPAAYRQRTFHPLGGSQGWGGSKVALNSSFVASTNDRYGWDPSQAHLLESKLPRTPQQSQQY